MKDNDFLESYKKNLESDEGMFMEETPHIEKIKQPENDTEKTTRRTQSPKGRATRQNPTRHVSAPDESMTLEEKNAFYADRYAQYANAPKQGGGYGTGRLVLIFVMLVVLIAGISALVYFSGQVTVLNFAGWDKNDFMLWANQNRIVAQTREVFDDDVEEGKIISQMTPPGAKIRKNDFMSVVISKGHDMSVEYYLPDLLNMTKEEIEIWAMENHMEKVRISVENSDTIPKGQVITFEINDDTVIDKVKRSTPIYIIISRGSESEYQPLEEIRIPNFKTMGLSATMLFAQENGLEVVVNNQYDDYVPENTIIFQSLSEDSIAHPGDTVVLTVSRGQKVIMPSFKQLEQSDAMSLAARLGIPVKIKERYSSSDKGRMIYQSIDVGSEIVDGMTLELTYSMGSQITVSNFIGQQKFIIEEWMRGENEYGARLDLNISYTQNSAPKGQILQQDIRNAFVYRDTTITIVVSTGNAVFVPDFVAVADAGYDLAVTREKAETMAREAGVILLFTEATDSSRLAGEVWWQSISAGTEVEVGTVVTLRYNPVNVTLDLPDFSGKTVEEVKAMPEYDNLKVIFQLGKAEGTGNKVYDQSIVAYSTVAYGTEVILYVTVAE